MVRNSLASTALILFAAVNSSAALIEITDVNYQGTGLGAVNTILTMQSHANSTEASGCVSWNGGGNTIGASACNGAYNIGGSEKTGASQTKTVELGVTGARTASELYVVYNSLEPSADSKKSITLQNIVLQLYAPNGTMLFASTDANSRLYPSTYPGTGNSGFLYRLDEADINRANIALAGYQFNSIRAGLSATVLGDHGGFETFHLIGIQNGSGDFPGGGGGFPGDDPGDPSAVPEPSSMALFALGAGGIMLGRWRRAAV